MRVIVLSTIDDWDLGQRLVDEGHEIVGWVTRRAVQRSRPRPKLVQAGVDAAKVVLARVPPVLPPPRRFDQYAWLAGRGLTPIAVPDVNTAAFIELVREKQAEVMLVAMFPQILKPDLLSVPGLIALNYHPSPLPAYAGPQPTFWILRNGETETAVTVHRITEAIDAGDIVAQEPVTVQPDDDNARLNQRLHHRAAGVLADTVTALAEGRAVWRPQDPAQRSYFPRSKPEDRELRWTDPAESICNLLRAMLPWQRLSAAAGSRRLLIHAARPVDGREGAEPGQVLRRTASALTVQTGAGALEISGYEVAPFHGWMNRLARLATPRTGQRLV